MKKALVFILVFVLIGSVLGLYLISNQDTNQDNNQENNGSLPPEDGTGPEGNTTYSVTYIVDGDTIEIETGERVRLIGIDTPESYEPYYSEATAKLTQLIGNNKVRLESDVEDEDYYGRLLRYIWVGDLHINLEMVRIGYAEAYPYPPNTKYASLFESAEIEARTSGIGMWATEEVGVYVLYVHENAAGDDWDNLNDEYIVIKNNGATIILTNWTVNDEVNHVYTFPEFVFDTNATVILHTGTGVDIETDLYWGSSAPIWNNDHDTVYLRDANGVLVDTYGY